MKIINVNIKKEIPKYALKISIGNCPNILHVICLNFCTFRGFKCRFLQAHMCTGEVWALVHPPPEE